MYGFFFRFEKNCSQILNEILDRMNVSVLRELDAKKEYDEGDVLREEESGRFFFRGHRCGRIMSARTSACR